MSAIAFAHMTGLRQHICISSTRDAKIINLPNLYRCISVHNSGGNNSYYWLKLGL